MFWRDDFRLGNSSLFTWFFSQGWFPSGKCILICRKALAGMIFVGKMHPDMQKSSCRDDFRLENSSLFTWFFSQGWFPAGKLILNCRKALVGMISVEEMHPELQKSSCRDDFQRGNASWFSRIVLQGWFLAGKCILIYRKCLAGMISSGEMHPDMQKSSCRDDFQRGNASWFAGNVLQGWFPVGRFILNCRKSLAGMISSGKIDPDLQKSSCRDDFQGKCILICKKALAGMIPAGEMHPDMQKSSCRDDSRREMHPDLVGLQESREKPYEMSTK